MTHDLVGQAPPSHRHRRQALLSPKRTDGRRDHTPPHYRKMKHVLAEVDAVAREEHVGLCLVAVDEPDSVNEALDEACSKSAMDAELTAIRGNKTWEFTALPAGHRAIGLKWVFKVKRDPSGKILKHKVRLVAKGYAERQGVDYDEVNEVMCQGCMTSLHIIYLQSHSVKFLDQVLNQLLFQVNLIFESTSGSTYNLLQED